MCSHVKDRILVESDTFVHFRVKNIVSVSTISAVNLIVGWKFFAFRRNYSILLMFVSHADMTSLINLGFKVLILAIDRG